MVQEFLKDLEKVVNVDAGTACTEGVKQVAETFKQHYEGIGFTARLVDLGDKVGPALFATNKPEATHYDVMLNAHLDTVFPAAPWLSARCLSRVIVPMVLVSWTAKPVA